MFSNFVFFSQYLNLSILPAKPTKQVIFEWVPEIFWGWCILQLLLALKLRKANIACHTRVRTTQGIYKEIRYILIKTLKILKEISMLLYLMTWQEKETFKQGTSLHKTFLGSLEVDPSLWQNGNFFCSLFEDKLKVKYILQFLT